MAAVIALLRAGLLAAALLAAALLSGGCALLAQPAPSAAGAAQTAAQVDPKTDRPTAASAAAAPGTAAPAAPAVPAPPSLRLVVDAPAPLRALLEKYLDLARLQALPGDEAIDETEWLRLVGAAPAQARELAQTEGYFEAQVSVQRSVDNSSAPPRHQVLLQVAPGPRTLVSALRVQARGALKTAIDQGDADARAVMTPSDKPNTLKAGQPFRNRDWADIKQQWLARLRAAGYAAASLADSGADVDATTRQAELQITLDSGPLYRAGPLQIEGLRHHDAATVRNLAGFEPGTPLTETRLLDFQGRLQKAGLFESVNISFDPAPDNAAASTVKVRLAELALQQATVGLGISANTGPRATLEHTHRRAFGQAVTAHNKLEWGRDSQSWAGDFQTHPGEGFYRNLLGVQVERVRSTTDLVLTQRLRLGRTQDTPRIERLYFLEWLRSRQSDQVVSAAAATAATPAPAPNTASAVSANYHWVWRELDSVLLPTRGLSLSLQAGAGQARSDGGNSGPFARLYGRLTGYLPLGANWYGQARLEAGQIVKADSVTVPDALGFRAGGDESVRGYAYRSLAPVGANGGTVSGQVLLSSSIELARPISPGLPNVWGAVFIDAGRAVERWSGLRPAVGYGAGVRWRSPIGPLRADLAWAEELRRLRLHFSVGIAF